MTITALLVFMVLSQIALAGYVLCSFNDVERAARKRNTDMRGFIQASLTDFERRLNGSGAPAGGASPASIDGQRSPAQRLQRHPRLR